MEGDVIKICFVGTNIYPLFNEKVLAVHGGSELQMYLTARELSAKHFEISFVTGDFGQDKIETFGKIKLFKSFNPKSNDSFIKKFIYAVEYYILFKQINSDIYFTSAANSTVGLVSLFCKLNKKKHIHRTAHESEVDNSYYRKGLLGKIYLKGLKSSDLVITQNETHKKLLHKYHQIDAKVLKNSFEVNSSLDISEKESVLWVARCEQWKRPELFLEMATKISSVPFIMIAPPANENEDFQREIKEKASHIKNLRFVDRVPFSEIQKYFDTAKVFVNTSDLEGFPNTFLQAGMGKTPIVSLNVNPDNFITEYNCGFFCEGKFEKLIEYTNLLINDRDSWKGKSEGIYNYVKMNHDIKKNVSLLVEMIHEIWCKQ